MIVSSKIPIDDRIKVLILGNGFDLDLCRKTSYKDFYESKYCPKDYPGPLIKHLNEKWIDNLEAVKWYDLENELYNYYNYIESKNFRIDVFSESEKYWIDKFKRQEYIESLLCIKSESDKHVVRKLIERGILKAPYESSYISLSTEDLFLPPDIRDFKALQLIKEGLMKYLAEIEEDNINQRSVAAMVAKHFANDELTINRRIYSFNYTDVRNISKRQNMEFDISYVHGSANDRNIILGTKDGKYDSKYEFLQKSFDVNYNPPAIVYDLMEAEEVVIFGHSLGVNDNQYFKAFFEKQSSPTNPSKKKITIFTKDEKSEIAIKRSLNEMTNYNLTSLYSLNDLRIIKTDDFYNGKITSGDIMERL